MKIPGYLCKREHFTQHTSRAISLDPKDYECNCLSIKRVLIRETCFPGSQPLVALPNPNEYSVYMNMPNGGRIPVGNPYSIPSAKYLEIEPPVIIYAPKKDESTAALCVSRNTEGCAVEAEISIYFDADDGADDPFKAPSDKVMSEQFEKKVEQLFKEWASGPWKEEGK